MAKHTYSVGSHDFSTLSAAKKKAQQYANEEGYPMTIVHTIQKTDKYTKTRGRVLGFSAGDIYYGKDIVIQPKLVKNPIWPFGPGQPLGSRHYVYKVKGKSSGKSSTVTRYKGYAIYKRQDGNYSVPSLTGNDGSYFEDKNEAKRFIAASVRRNPSAVIVVKNPASWFKRCVEGVKKSGSGYDPGAVCGSVMRRKKAKGR
jgi:hypothetical protein